jgi:hypothetical protein
MMLSIGRVFGAVLVVLCAWQPQYVKGQVASYSVGEFKVTVNGTDVAVRDSGNRVVWETAPGVPMIRIGECGLELCKELFVCMFGCLSL